MTDRSTPWGRRLTTATAALVLALAAGPRAQTSGPYHDLDEATRMMQAGQYARAEAILLVLREAIPESGSMWFALATSQQRQGKTEPALAAAHEALKRNAKHADAHLLVAEIEAAARHADRVVKHVQLAVESDGERLGVVRAGIRLLEQARAFELALQILAEASARHPADTDLLRLRIKVALGVKRLDDAAAAHRALLKVEPKDPQVMASLANVYRAMGKKREAVETFLATLQINPSNNAVRARLIALMEELEFPAKQLRTQRLYLRYYARAKPAARPPQPRVTPPPPRPSGDK